MFLTVPLTVYIIIIIIIRLQKKFLINIITGIFEEWASCNVDSKIFRSDHPGVINRALVLVFPSSNIVNYSFRQRRISEIYPEIG